MMKTVARHLTAQELEEGLDEVKKSPKDDGVVELIVRRPSVGAREVLPAAELDVHTGLVGDSWNRRASHRTRDGSPHPDMQLNLMNARAIALIAGSRDRWPLAGDQLYIDLDLASENLPPGTRLALGTAVIEVTPEPHIGCRKFVQRFGAAAMKFVNSPVGRRHNLRGINARVVQPGRVAVGDVVRRLVQPDTDAVGDVARRLPTEPGGGR